MNDTSNDIIISNSNKSISNENHIQTIISNMWAEAYNEVKNIIINNKKSKPFLYLHKLINDILNIKNLDEIALNLNELIREFLEIHIKEFKIILLNLNAENENSFLNFSNKWNFLIETINYLRKLFAKFESLYFEANDFMEIYTNNIRKIFINYLKGALEEKEIKNISDTLCEIVNKKRKELIQPKSNSMIIDTDNNELFFTKHTQILISFIEETGLYHEGIRHNFTDSTIKYYEVLSSQLNKNKHNHNNEIEKISSREISHEFNLQEYFKILDSVTLLEKQISEHFEDESLLLDLYKIINELLINNHKKLILQNAFPEDNNQKTLSNLSALEISEKLKKFDSNNPVIQLNHEKLNSSNYKNLNELDLLYKLLLDSDRVNKEIGISYFFTKTDLETFTKVYSSLKCIKEVGLLKQYWINFLKTTFLTIFDSFETFIFYMGLMKEFIDDVILKCFENDDSIKQITKETIHKLINSKPSATAEMYSVFLNILMTNKNLSEKELGIFLTKFFSLFKFLEAKDAFLKFFSRQLHIRILYNTTLSVNFEKIIIEKLKNECGDAFSSRPEEMIGDIEGSQKLTDDFIKSIKNKHNKPEFEFNYQILNDNNWTWLHSKLEFDLVPKDFIDQHLIDFSSYYVDILKGRKLYWKQLNSNGVIKFNISKNKALWLEVDLPQLKILNLYNKKKHICHSDLSLPTFKGISNCVDLKKTLANLVKHEILRKEGDNYYVNYDTSIDIKMYSDKNPYIIHEIYDTKISASEAIEIEEKTIEDRKPVVDCLIMKSLKSNKIMKLDDLVVNIKAMSRFLCGEKLINDRVDYLLLNEFIFKDDEENLKYVA